MTVTADNAVDDVPSIDAASLPGARVAAADQALAAFRETVGDAVIGDAGARLRVAFAASDFLCRVARDRPAVIAACVSGEAAGAPLDTADYRRRIAEQLADTDADDTAALGRVLRRERIAGCARIAWRDLFRLATIDDLLAEQSALAEACVGEAVDRLVAATQARHGVPSDAEGAAQSLVILGMGKLGGHELNFSSDIDLIFVYGSSGETDGARSVDNHTFFTRLGQQLIAALDERTADGFVYRVDMRLRPFGASGPLVVHLGQLEQYLLTQAREWERFALVKARALTGDAGTIEEIESLRRPFVFRRYLDFGAFEALRELKARLEREVERKGLHGNVKFGRGGIREIEFIAQAFQMIRGGRERALRTRSLLGALEVLAETGELSRGVVDELAAAYRYLRRVENRLQLFDDARVHALPTDEAGRERLAWMMGEADWKAFRRRLDTHMQAVHERFQRVFNLPAQASPQRHPLAAVWAGDLDDDQAAARLEEAGYEDGAAVVGRLRALREGALYRVLTTTARGRLDRLLPMVLADAAQAPAPARTLGRLLGLLEAVARRSVYLSLLAEHPDARRRLVELCGASAWIADFVTHHPILLDELLDPESLYDVPDRPTLEAEVEAALAPLDEDDLESQMDALRQVKQVNVLRVAAVDISGRMALMHVSDRLTDIAEVILAAVHRLAWRQLVARHGRPTIRVGDETQYPGLGIAAYGKLGGIELGYGSDLDLVFLHEGEGDHAVTDGTERPLDNAAFFGRLAQRMVHMLNTVTPAGVLYDIDTRLRPNGSSGLLVSSVAAFERYQRESAWTWEHQALVRARMVVGNESLCERFREVRSAVLRRPRDPAALLADVVGMRERMRRELAREEGGRFDLKQGAGGVADIEFMVQYGVLHQAAGTPGLAEYTDNIRLIEALAYAGHFDADTAGTLTDAYRAFRARIHRLALLDEPAIVAPDAELDAFRADVTRIWAECMGGDPRPPGD